MKHRLSIEMEFDTHPEYVEEYKVYLKAINLIDDLVRNRDHCTVISMWEYAERVDVLDEILASIKNPSWCGMEIFVDTDDEDLYVWLKMKYC